MRTPQGQVEFDHWYDSSAPRQSRDDVLRRRARRDHEVRDAHRRRCVGRTIGRIFEEDQDPRGQEGNTCLDGNSFRVNNKLGFVEDSGSQWVHEFNPIPNDHLVTKFWARFDGSSSLPHATSSQAERLAHSSPSWYIDSLGLRFAS